MASDFGTGQSFGQTLLDNVSGGIAPIFSAKPSAKYTSGARCVIRVNNRIVGFAFQASWRINTVQEEIFTIDDYLPYELAPQRISVEGTLGMWHIPGQGASAEYTQSNVLSFMTHRYISIEIRDSATNDLLFQTSKAAITSRIEDVKTDELNRITLSFKAIGWQDEKAPTPQKTQEVKQFQDDGKGITPNTSVVFDTPPYKIPGSFDPSSIA